MAEQVQQAGGGKLLHDANEQLNQIAASIIRQESSPIRQVSKLIETEQLAELGTTLVRAEDKQRGIVIDLLS
ncbi:MAG: hypothetical protein HQL32_10800 [Planctomycetes bacterium]|nr:hypothetical protein [Planctomycetota bacterium]